MKSIALTFLAVATLGACSTAPAEPRLRGLAQFADDPRLGEVADEICFTSTIDGFSMNERETVLLHEGRDRYMVEVSAGCLDLDFAEAIALDSTLSCLSRGDSIIVSRATGSSFGPQRCMIREIRMWDPKAEMPETAADENPA